MTTKTLLLAALLLASACRPTRLIPPPRATFRFPTAYPSYPVNPHHPPKPRY